ncbi:UNVERIFIED_CONTAM: hypothetical protein PYX00_009414 [Menopon gallinae]|uniref:EGF-like domain-containing protein n=1 Tax=Menopon gallinae TaxID=328185 RepID=A0AAW2HBW9_9NEOP
MILNMREKVLLAVLLTVGSAAALPDPCYPNPCGVHTQCFTTAGRPVCSCLPGYHGNPLTSCQRGECADNTECPSNRACRDNQCIDPCAGQCGVNANCEVRNHVPVCSCPHNYKGDPFTSCRRVDPQELCNPSPCGPNTECTVINNVPTCSCLPGYRGSCGAGATCDVVNHRPVCRCPENYLGDPYVSCRAECVTSGDCISSRQVCLRNKCVDPCKGVCGINANCRIRDGTTAVCSCPKDMTGDPFVRCRPFEKRDLCTPNPCGTNAQCTPGYDRSGKDRPVCTCPPGYIGNALVSCTRGECQYDSDCPSSQVCDSNYRCTNPCSNQCGSGAECRVVNHVAVCSCPPNTSGDALVSCYPVSRAAPRARYYNYYYRK